MPGEKKQTQLREEFWGLYEKRNPKLQCIHCMKTFVSERCLRDHISSVHKKDKVEKCDKCSGCKVTTGGKCFHGKLSEFKCTLCGEEFLYSGHVRAHMHEKHGWLIKERKEKESLQQYLHLQEGFTCKNFYGKRDKDVGCVICHHKFLGDEDPLAHYKKVHGDGVSFKCHICERKFVKRGTIVRHLMKHDAVVPYHCRFCPNNLRWRQDTIKHLKLRHKDQMISFDLEMEIATGFKGIYFSSTMLP